MEYYWTQKSAASDGRRRTAVVGLGNPFHGDDGAGCTVARCVYELLSRERDVDLVESSASGFRLSEHLIGYHRAVIIDTLIDAQGQIGTVKRVEILEGSGVPPVSLHTGGFHEMLALARMAGLLVPSHINMYGIVIREPRSFSETLSDALVVRVPEIVSSITKAEFLDSGL
jgi:hydrogenase maturation protease